MLITVTFMRVIMLFKFSKMNLKKNSDRGARTRCAGAGSAFGTIGEWLKLVPFFLLGDVQLIQLIQLTP